MISIYVANGLPHKNGYTPGTRNRVEYFHGRADFAHIVGEDITYKRGKMLVTGQLRASIVLWSLG